LRDGEDGVVVFVFVAVVIVVFCKMLCGAGCCKGLVVVVGVGVGIVEVAELAARCWRNFRALSLLASISFLFASSIFGFAEFFLSTSMILDYCL